MMYMKKFHENSAPILSNHNDVSDSLSKKKPDFGAHLKLKFSNLGIFNILNGPIKKSSIVTHLNSRFTKF